jgi:lysozyme family protein
MFERALQFVLKHEGGYVNDPRDPGGETKYGISQRAFPGLDIKNLTVEQAGEIYRAQYWLRIRGDELPAGIGLLAFDMAVNMGCTAAVKALQRAVGASPDGVLGPRTLHALAASSEADVIRQMGQIRAAQYVRLPTFPVHGVGWLNRLIDAVVTAMQSTR